MSDLLSAKEAAREIGIDARSFRKFMRAILPKEDQPGQGNRYGIEPGQIKKLKKQYAEWSTKPATKAETNGETPKAKTKKGKKTKSVEAEELDEVEEPTAEQLDDLDLILEEDLEDLDNL